MILKRIILYILLVYLAYILWQGHVVVFITENVHNAYADFYSTTPISFMLVAYVFLDLIEPLIKEEE